MIVNLEDRFYKVFSNLPLGVREETILVINDDPISWKVAKLEIDNKTPLSKQILEKLAALKFI